MRELISDVIGVRFIDFMIFLDLMITCGEMLWLISMSSYTLKVSTMINPI